jgi:cytochrome oxidase Cu insertion factor (SCO1/SenC/PrrC family)
MMTCRGGALSGAAPVVMLAVVTTLVVGTLPPAAGAHEPPRRPAGSVAADLIPPRYDYYPPRFDYRPPRPGTYQLPAVKPAADGQVTDASGVEHRLHEFLGDRIVVLSFISTRCTDAHGCPLATAVLQQVREAAARDRALAQRLRLVTVSFDLGYDTPAVLARFAPPARNGQAKTSPWEVVVPTSENELASIVGAYGQPIGPGGVDAPPTHLLRVYLIDGQRQIRNVYGLDFLDPRLVLNDVRTLLLEERRRP